MRSAKISSKTFEGVDLISFFGNAQLNVKTLVRKKTYTMQ